jgi:hypothetical protein
MKLGLQAHLVLESKVDFRLTSGLENAPPEGGATLKYAREGKNFVF